jgi:hypothetical protein
MKKLRIFKCSTCKKEDERLVDDGATMVECECGKQATRTISAPRCFGNTTGKSPSRH